MSPPPALAWATAGTQKFLTQVAASPSLKCKIPSIIRKDRPNTGTVICSGICPPVFFFRPPPPMLVSKGHSPATLILTDQTISEACACAAAAQVNPSLPNSPPETPRFVQSISGQTFFPPQRARHSRSLAHSDGRPAPSSLSSVPRAWSLLDRLFRQHLSLVSATLKTDKVLDDGL